RRPTAAGPSPPPPPSTPRAAGLDPGTPAARAPPLAQASLQASAFVASPDGNSIKLARQRGSQGSVRRLIFRTKNGTTRWKLRLTAPTPGSLPDESAIALQTGSACLASPAVACRVRGSAAACR